MMAACVWVNTGRMAGLARLVSILNGGDAKGGDMIAAIGKDGECGSEFQQAGIVGPQGNGQVRGKG